MQNDKEPFSSEFVDEQVERLAHLDEIHHTSADQQALTPETRLVQDMSRFYQEYTGTRDRVWQRLEQHMQQPSLTQRPITGKLILNKRKSRMIQRELERRGRAGYRLTLIAAAFIIVLLVGSMVLIPSALKTLRNSNVGGPGKVPTVLPPTVLPPTVTPFASPRVTPTQSPSPGCQTNQLAIASVRNFGGAGNQGDFFYFVNCSSTNCTLSGYPSIQMFDSHHNPIPTYLFDSTEGYFYRQIVQTVPLQPGSKAYFLISWTLGDLNDGQAFYLSVTPPGNQMALPVASGFQSSALRGKLTISPVEPTDFIP